MKGNHGKNWPVCSYDLIVSRDCWLRQQQFVAVMSLSQSGFLRVQSGWRNARIAKAGQSVRAANVGCNEMLKSKPAHSIR
jgi:hypothetical protein